MKEEIVDEDILLCKIEVLIEGIEELEIDDDEELLEEIPQVIDVIEEDRACDSEVETEDLDKEEMNEDNAEILNSLFSNLDDDTFKSYTVYIVRENDTIETIMEKYNVTKEELAKYNDLDNITINSKLVIPSSNED